MKKLHLLTLFLAVLFIALPAFAGEGGGTNYDAIAWIGLGAGLCIALAAFGGAFGQGKAAAAALEGIARNPGASGKVFVPMILGLALIESLVIYALLIAFQLVGKIDKLLGLGH